MNALSYKILYTGAFRFPDLDAAATRVQLVGKCLGSSEYDIEYLSWEAGDPSEIKEYSGFKYRNIGEFRVKDVNFLFRILGFLFIGRKTLKWLFLNKKFRDVNVFILYNPPSFFAFFMLVFSKIYGFKIVLDSTEWYESEHLPGGKYGIAAFENYIRMSFVYKMFRNVICISDYLYEYYSNRPCVNLVFLPALSDFCSDRYGSFVNSKISIVYAGNPGKKDKLKDVVLSLPELNSFFDFEVVLDLYGPTYTYLEEILTDDELDLTSKYFNCFGRVSQDKVIEAYSKASFSLLLRESKRYALAGFPTKVVESWASGVPVITNAVGCLKNYCTKDNSIIVGEDVIFDVKNALKGYDFNTYMNMREASFLTAKEFFSVGSNSSKVCFFMRKVLE